MSGSKDLRLHLRNENGGIKTTIADFSLLMTEESVMIAGKMTSPLVNEEVVGRGIAADLIREIPGVKSVRQNAHSGESFDPVRDIEEFHKKFQLTYDGPPRALTGELGRFRGNFIDEEAAEYNASRELVDQVFATEAPSDDAFITQELGLQLDALVDLVYVVLGAAYLHGFDFREAWRRVHAANMKKVRCERPGDSKRGTTFDVIKPDGWEPPDHSDLVENHAHRSE